MIRALIIGAAGQDGSYLSEYLCSKGYRVTGMVRRNPESVEWLQSMLGKMEFVFGDVRDPLSLETAIRRSWPDEIYNLAAQAFNPQSWAQPDETMRVNAGGLANLLQIVERVKADARVFQASTAEMFGERVGPVNEETPFQPISPYSVSKLAAHYLVAVYRRRGLHVCAGILANHESPRRGLELVTRKITRAVAAWSLGEEEILPLGNLDSSRDWGYAGEYVQVMHKMLQNEVPTDYVIGSGESHSVREFLKEACLSVGMAAVPEHLVKIDTRLVRKEQEKCLVADSGKLYTDLGWMPQVKFSKLVDIMVQSEVASLKARGVLVKT